MYEEEVNLKPRRSERLRQQGLRAIVKLGRRSK